MERRQYDVAARIGVQLDEAQCRPHRHPRDLASSLHRRAVSLVAWASRRHFTRTVETHIFLGRWMRVVLPEIVGADLHRNGYIEPEITQAMLRVLEPGSCCIDVGAHYGYHSVVAALLVGSCGSVLAIEPSSRTRRLLMENVEGLSQVRVLGIAVLDTRSTVELRDFGATNSALSTVMEAARVPGSVGHSLKHRARRVDALSLDDIVGQQKIKPAFVKIDAEGAEIAVLNGMQATLERDRPVVTLEVGDYDGGSLSRVSITKLGDAGYIGLEYLSGAFIRHRARDSYGYGNLVFVPEESSEAWLAG